MTEIKYDRQNRIPEWDQVKLSNSSVAVIGAGALGNHVCLGLIGLGIGTIKIYDFDEIKPHNLNRQSLFREEDIGHNKAEALAELLQERNSSVIIIGVEEKIEDDTIEEILRNIDVIIDCVDLIYVRKILNRYCINHNIPLIHGGISWTGGQTGILTRETPCINCIYPNALQEEEIDTETSCTRKPEPSVVYISQIIAGMMVLNVRKVLLPLSSDQKSDFRLFKLDFRLANPFYFEPIKRKKNCECVKLLKKLDPSILKNEQRKLKKLEKENMKELAKTLSPTFKNQKISKKSAKLIKSANSAKIKKKTSKRTKKSKKKKSNYD